MAVKRYCDVCRKPIDQAAAKLFLAPRAPGYGKHKERSVLGRYTASAEVGECCIPQLTKMINWTKRKKNQVRTPAHD